MKAKTLFLTLCVLLMSVSFAQAFPTHDILTTPGQFGVSEAWTLIIKGLNLWTVIVGNGPYGDIQVEFGRPAPQDRSTPECKNPHEKEHKPKKPHDKEHHEPVPEPSTLLLLGAGLLGLGLAVRRRQR